MKASQAVGVALLSLGLHLEIVAGAVFSGGSVVSCSGDPAYLAKYGCEGDSLIGSLPLGGTPTGTTSSNVVPTVTIVGGKDVGGSARGDPIMTGLDGRTFEFLGKAGKTYNILSEKTHQLSMNLKEGKMWDHNGTYMSAVGLRYLDNTVEVTDDGDALTVSLNGEALVMRPGQTEEEVLLGLTEGQLELLWQLHRPGYGNAVQLTTDMLDLLCWVTPAGTHDEGGLIQPAYLNFDLSLHATPAHGVIEGILGETYVTAATTVAVEDDFKFHGVEADYEMASLFDTASATSVFGKAHSGRARKLNQLAHTVTLPQSASSRGFDPVRRASGQGLIRSRKDLN